MIKNNAIVLIASFLFLLMLSANASSFILNPGGGYTGSYNTVVVNQTVYLVNSSLPSGYGPVTYKAYYISGPNVNPIYNTTGIVAFSQPGNYTAYEEAYNSSGINLSSSDAYIDVRPDLKATIQPAGQIQAVYGQQVSLTAVASGGIPSYGYMWYNNSACNRELNYTGSVYTTNILNSTISLNYCVRINDSDNEVSYARSNITIEPQLYTSQGEITSFGNHSAILPVSIIIPNSTSYLAENVTPYSVFNVSCSGETFTNYAVGLTPSFINMSIDGTSYGLFVNQRLPIGTPGCFVKLLNISWNGQLISTASLDFYYSQPTTTVSTSTSTISTTSLSTASTTSVSTTTTISQLTAKISASNSIKTSNQISVGQAESNVGGFIIGGGIITVIIVAVVGFLVLNKRKKKFSSSKKPGMVNL